jgi:hypothetical protein
LKTICLSIIYNKFDIIEKSLDRFYELNTYNIDEHIIVDNIYPLDANSKKIKSLADKLNVKYFSNNKNLGLFTTIEHFCQQEDHDTLFMINESNNYVLDKGFDEALIKAYIELKQEDNEIVVSLGNKNNDELDILNKNGVLYSIENNGEKKVGKELKGYPYAGINVAGCGFLKEVILKSKNKYYGDPYKDFIQKDRIGYILRSHNEISDYFYEEEDEIYRIYKMIVLYLDYKKSFEDYIKVHNDNPEYTIMFLSELNRINYKIIDYIKYKKNNLNKL